MTSTLPAEVTTTVKALHSLAAQFSGPPGGPEVRDELYQIADQVEHGWDSSSCPFCEEIECDQGCPLGSARARKLR